MLKRILLFLGLTLASCISNAVEQILMPIEKPTNYVNDGKITGTSVAIIERLRQELAGNKPIEVLPFARAYSEVLSRPNSIIFTVAKTPDRTKDGLVFIGPISTPVHAVFKRADHKFESKQALLDEQIPIAGLRADMRTELLKSQGFNVVEVTEHSHGLKMLKLGRIDYWISSDMETASLDKNALSDSSPLNVAWIIKQDPGYFAFSPGSDPALIKLWQSTFENLNNSTFYQQQVEYWRNELNIPIEHTPEKGFHITTSALYSLTH